MTDHLYILTGASRGLGLGLAEQLLAPGHRLLCVSRQVNDTLTRRAAALGCPLEQWALDLEQGAQAAERLAQWLGQQSAASLASATLINNAGMIPRLAPLSDSDPLELSRALRVGLEAPLLLSAAFLGATAGWQLPRRVLNISSGLGRHAMASQAPYGAAKAGMDHFTRCLALEESLKPRGARVCSLAPGVIDTDMQTQLRSADPQEFPDQGRFLQLKDSGQLSSAREAAQRVLTYLARPDFGAQPVADVREQAHPDP